MMYFPYKINTESNYPWIIYAGISRNKVVIK